MGNKKRASLVATILGLSIMSVGSASADSNDLMDRPAQVAVGGNHSCVLMQSGAIRCWGSNQNSNESTVPTDLGPASAIVTTASSSCAIVNRALRCWGNWQSGDIPAPEDLSDVAAVFGAGLTTCVLDSLGIPRCWGNNYSGQSAVPVGTTSLTTMSINGGRTCGRMTDARLTCWGNTRFFSVGGSSLPGASKFSTNTNYLCYLGWADNPNYFYCGGDDPFGYLKKMQALGSALTFDANGANICAIDLSAALQCTGPNDSGLNDIPTDIGNASSVAVGERHACAITAEGEVRCWGANDYGQSSPPGDLMKPSSPDKLSVILRTSTGVQIGWVKPSGGGSVEGYVLEYSTDEGLSWKSTEISAANATSATVKGLTSATALAVRVFAKNGLGRGAPSPTLRTATAGTNSFKLKFVDANSMPVTGGSVSWRLADKSAWSSHSFGLTSQGMVDVLAAPAGAADVTFAGASTAEGATVNGSIPVMLGSTRPAISLPESLVRSYTITVTLPNGVPVSHATVELVRPTLSQTVGSLRFTVPSSLVSAVTDESGTAKLTSIEPSPGGVSAQVSFNDGEITQQKTIELAPGMNAVTLDYMPWIDAPSHVESAGSSKPVSITVDAMEPQLPALTRRFNGSPLSGVSVSLLPPTGYKSGKCKSILSSKTGFNGRATLTVCPSASTIFSLNVRGATGTRKVEIRVPGYPLAPHNLKAQSPTSGGVKLTWEPPIYTGKKAVTAYVATIKCGRKSWTATTMAGSRMANFSKLPNATKCTVGVRAKVGAVLSPESVTAVAVA